MGREVQLPRLTSQPMSIPGEGVENELSPPALHG